jgi:uncharacterized protein
MTDIGSYMLLSTAVFAGAFVSGLAGFAFSAVAGGLLLHVLQPLEAVPLMMACSICVQGANLWSSRKSIGWKESRILVLGGLLGVPIAVWLLHVIDAGTFREGFGIAVAAYAAYMLFRPSISYLQQTSQSRNALVGFGGGLIGGLTAMPGAIPTIWCDMHGMTKVQQRGLVQPFIAAMQLFALALMLMRRRPVVQGSVRPRFEYPGAVCRIGTRHFRVSACKRRDVQAHRSDRALVVGSDADRVNARPYRVHAPIPLATVNSVS